MEFLLVVAVILFAVGAIFSLPQTNFPYHAIFLLAGLAFFAGAFLYDLVNATS